MRHLKSWAGVLLLCLLAGCAGAAEENRTAAYPPDGAFAVRDGDVWVMGGDSITAQKLYTTYLEAFVRARYPQLKFVAVNSGKSGEVYIQGLIRFRSTIAAYKPTLITVNYGMNDHTKTFLGEQNFQDDPKSAPQRFVDAARLSGARLLMLSASPLLAPPDYSTDSGKFQLTPAITQAPSGWRGNPANRLFAEKLNQIAARNGVPFLDQMAPLQTIWGANYPRDRVAALRHAVAPLLDTPLTEENWRVQAVLLGNAIKPFLQDTALMAVLPAPDREILFAQWQGTRGGKREQWESLRLYLRGWVVQVDAANPPFVQVSGYDKSSRPTDLIHPNEAGHLHMAAVLLKLMKADGLVSAVALDARTAKLIKSEKANVRDVSLHNGVLSFKRLDESLPFPIDPLARPALSVDVPTPRGTPKDLFNLSRYLVTVANLPKGNYAIAIDGEVVTTASGEQLARGLDLGLLEKGPIADHAARVLDAVRANLKVAIVSRGETPAAPDVVPHLLPEAQPIEHGWRISPVR